MAYLSIQDFKYGMDRRRERVAGTPGTLWTLENAHITRGGDIERCKKWVPVYTLPHGSHGLAALNKQLFVFGEANIGATMPRGIAYQRLVSSGGGVMTRVVDTTGFAGKMYAIADYDDGGRFHFYNAARVTDWDTIAAASADYTSLAQFMAEKLGADADVEAEATGSIITITARVNNVAFTIAGGHVDGGGTADETITIATPQAAAAGVPQISTATFGGTFEALDTFSITINGRVYRATGLASGTGRSCNVFYKRVWSPCGSLWRYCKLVDAVTWNPATLGSDAGFLNVAQDVEGNQNLIAAERYQTYVGIYSETAVILYTLDTDPANFAQFTALDNTNTIAPESIIRYGNNDVFHSDPTGVRSLRALNSSNAPFVSDVGNAIDTFYLAFLATLTEAQRRMAVAAIEPRDGRLLLAVGKRIFVLSFFPGAKISAWSYYSPGFEVEAFAKIGNKLYARAGDTVYLYGGNDGETYPDDDEQVVTVELPFLSAGSPATKKGLDGFDCAATNEWKVDVSIDPNDPDNVVHIGRIVDTTYMQGDITVPGQAPLIALKMTCRKAGRATISMAQIHFKKQEEG